MSKEEVTERAIWGSYGLTINSGNFESVRIDAGSKRVIRDGDDEAEVWEALWTEIDDELTKKVLEAKEAIEGS